MIFNMKKNINKILLSLFLILMISLPWMTGSYILQLMIMIITSSMMGLTFSLGWKLYLIRLDLPAFMAVGAYTSAILMKNAGWPYWPTFLIGGLIAMPLGWGLARLALPRGGMIYFGLTMMFTVIVQVVLSNVQFFGGLSGILNVPLATIGSHIFQSRTEFYFLGLFLLILNIVVYYLLYNSRIGRAFTSIGTSPGLAASLGITPLKYRLAAVTIGSFFVSLAGTYYVGYMSLVFPDSFGFYQAINAQIYPLLGGLNYFIAGPIVGALIMTLIPEYFRIAAQFEPIISAIILIFIVVFMPNGILGLLDRWRVFPRLAAVIGLEKKSTLP
jgi:branched-chain amino acid transport system permease protein